MKGNGSHLTSITEKGASENRLWGKKLSMRARTVRKKGRKKKPRKERRRSACNEPENHRGGSVRRGANNATSQGKTGFKKPEREGRGGLAVGTLAEGGGGPLRETKQKLAKGRGGLS